MKIKVLYGVHNIRNHQVCMPVDSSAPRSDENVHLAVAPTNPKEFHALAVQLADHVRPHKVAPHAQARKDGASRVPKAKAEVAEETA